MSTFTVTNTADSGPGSLRDAIDQANTNAGDNTTIDFDPTVFSTPQTIALIGGQLELSNTSGTETIIGPAAGLTISGGGLGRVFQVDADVTASLSGITITGGVASGPGAGLANEGGTVTLTGCTVSGNSASSGGGVYTAFFGTTTLEGCTISGNSASGNGGGLYNFVGTMTVSDCTVSGNSAGHGGGLYDFVGTMTLTNVVLSGNSAANGGGMAGVFDTAGLTGCTFSGNVASASGGGLYNNGGTLTLTDCTFSGDLAGTNGGGLYNSGFGTATLKNCTFSGNSAASNGGGLANAGGTTAIYGSTLSGNSAGLSGAGLYNKGTATLTDAVVSGNSAGLSGAGLSTHNGTTTLTGCTVSGNSALLEGGGVLNDQGTTTMYSSTVSGNVAASGAGVYTYQYGTTSLTNCTVSGNSALGNGGGVSTNFSTTTLTDCTVSGNSALSGAGLYTDNHGSATLINVTVSGNTAQVNGGGLYTTSAGINSLANVTISGNSAGNSGGGLDNPGGTVSLGNTIVAMNAATTSGPDVLGTFDSLGNNLVGATDGSSGWVASDLTGTGAQPLNPLLAPLGDHGGSTQTMSLLPGSLAIDGGNNALIPSGITTDQRDLARVVNGVVDIGADESSLFTIVVVSGSDQSTGIGTDFQAPLVAKVTANNPLEPVAGGLVTYTPPQTGASAALGGNPATIAADGTVSVTATANGIVGRYPVSAGARGIQNTAIFTLTNQAIPMITTTPNMTTVVLGTSPVTLTDTAVLSKGYYETGSITFTLYLGNILVDTETVPVNGDGSYTTPTGYTLPTTGTVTGTYQWDASYTGDTYNTPAIESDDAAEQTVVSLASPTITTTSSVSALTLTASSVTLEDTAVLAGGYYETGTITFTLYLGGTPLDTEIVPVNGNGTYSTPTGYTLPTTGAVTGTYQWAATYSGDSNNDSAGDQGGTAEQTVISQANPAITTSSSVAALTLGDSTPAPLGDTAVLTGGYYPTGTITFTLTYNGAVVYTDHVAVGGDGTYSTAQGDQAGGYTLPTTGTVVGTYQWSATYSGDANNDPTSDQGGAAEQTMVYQASPAIDTVPGPGGMVTIGSGVKLTDSATVSGAYSPGGSITFYLFAPGVTPNATDSNSVYTTTVTVGGNGTYSTNTGTNPGGYTPTVIGTYQWVAVYGGDSNNNGAAGGFGSEPEAVVAPNLVITKVADASTVIAGQSVGFTVTISNTGLGTAYNLTLDDPLPAGAGGDVNWRIDGGQGNPGDFTITGSKGNQGLALSSYFLTSLGDSLAPGQNLSVHITSATNALDATAGPRASGFNPAGTAAAGVIGLGTASTYSVLGLKNTAITNSLVTITGDEGVSQGGSLNNMGPSAITGNVYEYASGQYSGSGKLGGSAFTNPALLAHNDMDALNASARAAGLTATQTFGSITSSTTITGNGGLNVIDINGSINLSNASLTLTGTASDVFIVNVIGTATFAGTGGLMLGGGVTVNHVLYNFTGSGGTITSHVGNTFYGTLLAPGESFILDGSFVGEIIGGGSSIQLLSGATVNSGIGAVLPNTATVTSTNNTPGILSASATISVTAPQSVAANDFATIGYWHNQNGQNLIYQLNGGGSAGTATALGTWLATNFPHLYGASVDPSNPYEKNLTGATNAQVASFYMTLFGAGGLNKTYAQVMAVALASYATNAQLAGGNFASQLSGFNMPGGGTGTHTYNVGSSGSSLGLSNYTSYSVLSILAAADALAAQGTSKLNSNLSGINTIFNGINSAGDITNAVSLVSPSGVMAYTPAQIRAAYGINSLSLDGTGQTIAIVDAYDDPSIYAAVDTFDGQFGLTDSGPTLLAQYGNASSFLTVLNQSGQSDSLPGTDPSGTGADNWEVEAALDVEWAHAIAPGAHIILVEANSQSLSDLMAAVATAAAQPGVSVVTMSWGFPEGQSVFAADEANYDAVFNVPGVTFLASTGDYGTADPEYPAFSPNVVAVGGTSLNLNTDSSYSSETGWGYFSDAAGTSIGSGGGLSLYQPEPSYQQGVQSTGSRTTPDVSLVADPATGAWIADPYNLDASNPFEIAGGTSLGAPAWAGLIALVNQGRVAAGESTLNSSGPNEAQQALYSLPQADYNVISSGNNGYAANPGYNLVTGLGTPVAGALVPDLVAYSGPGTVYPGPTVGPLLDATLLDSWTAGGGSANVFSVFNALAMTGGQGFAGIISPTAGVADRGAPYQTPGIADGPDGVVPGEMPDGSEFGAAIVASAAPASDTGEVGMMPLADVLAAHDAILSDWPSPGIAPKRRLAIRANEATVPAITIRTDVVFGRTRTAAFQGRRGASAIEGLAMHRRVIL